MRAVDERGRFLGLINIVDLGIGVLIVALLAGVAYKVFSPRATAPVKTVQFEFFAPDLRPQVAKAVKAGAVVHCTGGTSPLVAGVFDNPVRVTKVLIDPAYLDVTTAQGKRVRVSDPYLKDVIIWCRGSTPVAGGSINLAGGQIRAGSNFALASKNFQVVGYVLQVRWSSSRD